MIVYDGHIYLEKEHIELLKSEPEYVKNRYFAVAMAIVPKPFKICYKKAKELIEISLRHFYRITNVFVMKEFLDLG